jgi:ABC-type multidrug transport system fused ATPase/permease subunit
MQGFLAPGKGSIQIDDRPLDAIPRAALRNRIITLPQSPFFLPGGYTVRQNLEFHGEDDSFNWSKTQNTHSRRVFWKREEPSSASSHLQQPQDEDCEYALRKVSLWNLVLGRGGLDAEMKEDALSKGERQLFSLARAVVRARRRDASDDSGHGGILLLDEANTGLDDDAEWLMWKVVNEEFANYTVVCVAHGLAGVGHCDRVVLLHAGEIAEMATSRELLSKQGGRFKGLWERAKTGREDGDRTCI